MRRPLSSRVPVNTNRFDQSSSISSATPCSNDMPALMLQERAERVHRGCAERGGARAGGGGGGSGHCALGRAERDGDGAGQRPGVPREPLPALPGAAGPRGSASTPTRSSSPCCAPTARPACRSRCATTGSGCPCPPTATPSSSTSATRCRCVCVCELCRTRDANSLWSSPLPSNIFFPLVILQLVTRF
jgi:hypothetical protein